MAAFDSGNARHFDNMALLQAAVREALPTVGSVLVKGSRFMKMEQVLEDMVDTIDTVNRVSPTVQGASCNALGAPC